MYEIPNEKVDLPDGQWAVILLEKTHGTQAACDAVTRRALVYPEGYEGKGPPTESFELDWVKVDWTAVHDQMILGQVKSWSYGDEVSAEVLASIPERHKDPLYQEVAARCDRPLPGSDAKQ